MIEYLTAHWLLLSGGIIIGAAVGVLTGLFGAGGGFIITPALNIILGVDMNLAVGTSACQVLGASAFSLAHHRGHRLSGIRVALFIAIGIPLGSYPGARLVAWLKQNPPIEWNGYQLDPVNLVLLLVFSVFLFGIAGWMLYDGLILSRKQEHRAGLLRNWRIPPVLHFRSIPTGEFSMPVLLVLGMLMGFLSGLLGIGGGVIMLPALHYLVGQDIKDAAKTSMMLILVSGLFSTVFHALYGNINYPLAAALVAGAFAGTKFGAYLQHKTHSESLRLYFAWVVLLAWAMVIFKLAGMFLK